MQQVQSNYIYTKKEGMRRERWVEEGKVKRGGEKERVGKKRNEELEEGKGGDRDFG